MNFLLAPSSFDVTTIFGNIFSQWYYYIALILVIALAIFIVKRFEPQQENFQLKKTTKLAIIAILTALCVIANIFSVGTDAIKVSFVASVCFIAGFTLGPIGGLAVGFMGDLIAGIISPFGVYNPIIALGSALFGFIPGLLFWYFKGNEYAKCAICFLITYIISSVILNTTATYLMYFLNSQKYTIITYLGARLPITFLGQIINFVISINLIPILKKLKKHFAKEV